MNSENQGLKTQGFSLHLTGLGGGLHSLPGSSKSDAFTAVRFHIILGLGLSGSPHSRHHEAREGNLQRAPEIKSSRKYWPRHR